MPPYLLNCLHETEDDLPRTLFRRSPASVLAVRIVGDAEWNETSAVRPRTVREPDQRFFRDGCIGFRRRVDLLHATRECTVEHSSAVAPGVGCALGGCVPRLAFVSLYAGTEAGTTQVIGQQRSASLIVATSLFRQRATAIGRWYVRLQKIRHTLVSVNLILHTREAVAFVFVDLVIDRPATFLDGLDHLLRF